MYLIAHLPLPVDVVFTFDKFLHCNYTKSCGGGGERDGSNIHKSDVEI